MLTNQHFLNFRKLKYGNEMSNIKFNTINKKNFI